MHNAYTPKESDRAWTCSYTHVQEEEEEEKSEKKFHSPTTPWLLLRPIIQIPRASGSEGNHQNRMQRVATKITQRSRTLRSPPPNNTNAHALKNPRLLQIQHSPFVEFINLPSSFHLSILALRHHQPPRPPPSTPATGAILPPITPQPHHHRSKTRKLQIACLIVYITMKENKTTRRE